MHSGRREALLPNAMYEHVCPLQRAKGISAWRHCPQLHYAKWKQAAEKCLVNWLNHYHQWGVHLAPPLEVACRPRLMARSLLWSQDNRNELMYCVLTWEVSHWVETADTNAIYFSDNWIDIQIELYRLLWNIAGTISSFSDSKNIACNAVIWNAKSHAAGAQRNSILQCQLRQDAWQWISPCLKWAGCCCWRISVFSQQVA